MLFRVLPRVEHELWKWRKQAELCPEPELRRMALDSLKLKRFHCQGGSVFSLLGESEYFDTLITAIVAVQTISDYLDNLCDRLEVVEEESFRALHESLSDALRPGSRAGDYYRLYPYGQDGGYLDSLVSCSRMALAGLPSYRVVEEPTSRLASLYSELQSLKHISPDRREQKLTVWLSPLLKQHRRLYWWELAAATGSTLGMFVLFSLAARRRLSEEEARLVLSVYFPWICALHILLDYFIDQQEDVNHGDLNFVSYYSSKEEICDRFSFLVREATDRISSLPDPGFHRTVIDGLLALYLSDPKAKEGGLQRVTERILCAASPQARHLACLCSFLRRTRII